MQRTGERIGQGQVQIDEVIEKRTLAHFGIEGPTLGVLPHTAMAWPGAAQGAGHRRTQDAQALRPHALDGMGQLAFTPGTNPPVSLSVVSDLTSRGAGGPSVSALFGLGVIERGSRAERLSVDSRTVQDPNRLAMSRLDLSVAAGQPAIRPGDGSGARALAAAGEAPTGFDPAGFLGALTVSVSDYAAQFSAAIGRQAEAADSRRQTTLAVSGEVASRRQSVEGVNIDEELVRLTTYQQAFNASARMIQAAKELFDVLTNII